MNEKIPVKKSTDVVSQPTSTTSTAVEITQTIFSGSNLDLAQNTVTISRAQSYNIHLPPESFHPSESSEISQITRTINAYSVAGMTYEDIADTLEEKGNKVERGETDAFMKDGWQGKVGEVLETEKGIRAWQNRGEVISLIPQITAGTTLSGTEVVTTSQNLATNQQKVNVIEGINVQASDYTEVQTPNNNILQFPQNQAPIEQPASNVSSFSQFIRPLTDQELDEAA